MCLVVLGQAAYNLGAKMPVIEALLVVVSLLLIIQVIIPIAFGEKIFPSFRSNDVEKRKRIAMEKLRIAQLKKEAVELEVKAEIEENSILNEIVSKKEK